MYSDTVKITTEYVEKPSGELCFTKLFQPKDARSAKAMICFCVGFGDHTEWFMHDVGAKYAELGFVVFMHDHKGHGRSDGYFAAIDDFETDIVDEAIWVFQYAINKYIQEDEIYADSIGKHNNYFISGTSMGGAITIKIALKLQQKAENPFKGIILAAPMVAISEGLKPPDWQIWCMSNCLMPCCPYCKMVPNGLESSLTEDKQLQQKLDDNPVIYLESLSLSTAHHLYQTTVQIDQRAKELKIPMFICHGDTDVATDPNMSKRYYEQCGCAQNDKTLQIYKGKGHLIYEEEPQVFTDTVEWMMARIHVENDNTGNNKEQTNEMEDVVMVLEEEVQANED